jgi:hypothetical protein
MGDPVSPREATVRGARIVHGIMLALACFYPFFAEQLHPAASGSPPQSTLLFAFGAVAALEALMAFYFRTKRVIAAVERLRMQSDDSAALADWRAGCILVTVLTFCITLHGFTLRFLGFSLAQCIPFYVAAVALLLVWWPRLD